MRILPAAIGLLGMACIVHANPIQLTYKLNLGGGTLNGNGLTSLAIFETDGNQTKLDFPFAVPGSGLQSITHISAFLPVSSILVGLDLPSTNIGDNKTHVVFFTNDAFAAAANGILFSTVFPNTHHNDFITRLTAAEQGDASQITWLTHFFLTGDGAPALFATSGPSTAVEFTTGRLLVAPEPLSLSLLGLGLGAMLLTPGRRRVR